MANTCAQCSRVNPADAAYCHFDGSALHGAAGPQDVGAREFPRPFAFPSGHACRTFDQFARACQNDWAAAVQLLTEGALEKFFGGIGRIDLAVAARDAAAFPDADRGLDQFLAKLPGQALQPPKLEVAGPLVLNLGTLRPDTDHHFEIRLQNQGQRLLYGAVVTDCPWLTLNEAGAAQKLFQAAEQVVVPVTVHGRCLRAGGQGLTGRLVIQSNGGTVTVHVKASVPSRAFPEGLLAGARTPRQLAEKARGAPKEAARFFESGAVRAWYEENGWTYPVQGPNANGLGAVQQFFEALGLAKPPRIELSEQALSLQGAPGESVSRMFQVRALEKRPVFASAASDQPWLVVGAVQVTGSVATIPLQVNAVPGQAGQVLQARVSVTANGGQRFVVPVSLSVAGTQARSASEGVIQARSASEGISPLPIVVGVPVEAGNAGEGSPPRLPLPVPADRIRKPGNPDRPTEPEKSSRTWMLVGGLLLLLLLAGGGLAAVLASRGDDAPAKIQVAVHDDPPEDRKKAGPAAPPVIKVDIQDEPEERPRDVAAPVKHTIEDQPEERIKGAAPLQPVKVEIKDEPPDLRPAGPGGQAPIDKTPRVLYQYGNNGRFGIAVPALNKKLTYAVNGETNSTVVRVNGRDAEFGGPLGRWLERATRLQADPGGQSQLGTRCIWAAGKLVVTQILDVVPSRQPVELAPRVHKRLMDTVRVRYVLENKDTRPVNVGLRIQLDTMIGDNDGVPFTVPGLPGLVDQFADFPKDGPVPDFLQALERPDLRNPGTVAHVTLRLGGRMEPPGRVLLTHWPGFKYLNWEVPVRPLTGDSAVVLYWHEAALKPKQKRAFGFAYGLGSVSSSEGVGKLGVTLGGSFEPGQEFTVTAYVQNPARGQTLTLELPGGLERTDGPATAPVPVPPAGRKEMTSIVTWKAKVLQTGVFPLKVRSSTGVSQTKTITIARPDGPTGGKLALELVGASFEPGQTFTVVGSVTAPVAGQTLTLSVPKGLERVEGAETVPVPPPAEGGKDGTSVLKWTVRVVAPGKYPVRLVSSTGVVQTKTLTIVRPELSCGRFVLTLGGDFAPGKAFRVTAAVTDALPGQQLTLRLPAGLEREGGGETLPVPAAPGKGGVSEVSWQVKVARQGKFPVRVESSTGVVQGKTITIEQGVVGSGRFTLDLSGGFAPGKEFVVTAKVADPVPGQKLTLMLPKEMLRTEGAAEQTAAGQGTVEVRWVVRVLEAGLRLPLRVESSTGAARTKRISITEERNPARGELFK